MTGSGAERLRALVAGLELNAPATAAGIAYVENYLGRPLPEDYRAFLELSDGWEGFLGESYLCLTRTTELIGENEDCEIAEHAPGLFVFGSNGANELFAFDKDDAMAIRVVPLIGMCREDALTVAPDFLSFLARLRDRGAF